MLYLGLSFLISICFCIFNYFSLKRLIKKMTFSLEEFIGAYYDDLSSDDKKLLKTMSYFDGKDYTGSGIHSFQQDENLEDLF